MEYELLNGRVLKVSDGDANSISVGIYDDQGNLESEYVLIDMYSAKPVLLS